MDRRNFLKAIAVTGAAVSLKMSDGMDIMAQTTRNTAGNSVDLVAVMGGEPEAMFRRAIDEMGGIGRFVKRGNRVVVKPNIAWDRAPELAANTNPQLVGEIVRQCLAAGAREVVVFDHTCDDWRRAYRTSGIEAAARAAGARVIPGNEESFYRPVALPRGKRLKETKVHRAILDCDVWINVPVLKHHGGTNLTIAMKNLMGIVWDRRFFHRSDLQQCIADSCTLEKVPVLNVVDAYRMLKANGPRGTSAADVVNTKALFISPDMVAVDTASARFFDQIQTMPLSDVGHLAHGEALGVGTMNLDALNVRRVRL